MLEIVYAIRCYYSDWLSFYFKEEKVVAIMRSFGFYKALLLLKKRIFALKLCKIF